MNSHAELFLTKCMRKLDAVRLFSFFLKIP